MNRILTFGLLGMLALVAALPPMAAANHATCTNGSGIWLGPATGSNCVGAWVSIDPSIVCTRGVGHTSAGPVTVSGALGAGCPVGVVLHLP